MKPSLLVKLYPKYWRLRYEEEYILFLDRFPMSPSIAIDILRGAFDAHTSLRRYRAVRKRKPKWVIVYSLLLVLWWSQLWFTPNQRYLRSNAAIRA